MRQDWPDKFVLPVNLESQSRRLERSLKLHQQDIDQERAAQEEAKRRAIPL
jgi:hypothetical protein